MRKERSVDMSEFGNDAASTALKAEMEALKMLGKFLEYLMKSSERRVNAELKKEQLNEMKLDSTQRAAKLKLAGKSGYVRAKLLQKTGEPLVAIDVKLNDIQMKRFAALAKRYGLLFTSFSDKRLDGEKDHILLVPEKDLAKCKAITDRMTEELKLKTIDEKIAELESKENLTEQEAQDLEKLKMQKKEMIHGDVNNFNEVNAEIIFSDVCGEMQDKALSFDEALNHFTDRDYSSDKPYYLCERTKPDCFMELHSSRDMFNGEEYTRTEYKVYREGIEQKSNRPDGVFTDERFEGRPRYYWPNLKTEMKQKGGFSDDVIAFGSKDEFQRYQQLYREQQDAEMQKDTEQKDFANITEKLESQLNENGAVLSENGVVLDIDTKQPTALIPTMQIVDKARIAENILIGAQIRNYNQLGRDMVQLAMDKQRILDLDPQSPAYKELQEQIQKIQQRIGNGLQSEIRLLNERSKINGVQAAIEVDKEYHQEHALESGEHGERQERVEQQELDRESRGMQEWKGKIDEQREQISQISPTADRAVKKGIPKPERGDR